jgi:hypothetical protein
MKKGHFDRAIISFFKNEFVVDSAFREIQFLSGKTKIKIINYIRNDEASKPAI